MTFKFGQISIDPVALGIQGSAVLGIKDSGKSYTATGMAEHLFDAGIPFVTFDPTGIWRFLRVPGHGRGYPIVVAGGQHGDLPLSPHSAPAIVEAAMQNGVSLVLDLFSMELSKADWRRIVRDSVRLMMHRNAQYGLRHIFIEEAAEFVPQKVTDGDVYAEMEKLARMGGNSRLGYTLINQRSQEVNKAVLELCENLFLHRQKGKNALENLTKWLEVADVGDHREIIKTLPNLPTGECWAWLAGSERPVHVKVPKKNSLHPDRRVMRGDTDAQARPAVDVGKFVETMRGTLQNVEEEAKANDPKLLRARVRELERQLARGPASAPAVALAAVSPKAAEYRALEQRLHATRTTLENVMKFIATVKTIGFPEKIDSKKLETAISAAVDRVGQQINAEFGAKRRAFDKWQADGEKLLASIEAMLKAEVPIEVTVRHNEPFSVQPARASAPVRPSPARAASQPIEGVSRSQQKILESLAMLEGMGIAQPTRTQLALWSEVSSTSGGYFNNLGALRTAGLIEYPSGGTVALTDAGRERAPAPAAMSVEEMQESLCTKVGASKAAIVRALIGIYPKHISRDELAERIGVSATSGGYFNNLGALRTLGIIDYPEKGHVAALPVLFLETA